MKKQYSVTAQVTYKFHTESKHDKAITSKELEDLANTALWGNYNELLNVEFEIECDGQSEDQDSHAINIED